MSKAVMLEPIGGVDDNNFGADAFGKIVLSEELITLTITHNLGSLPSQIYWTTLHPKFELNQFRLISEVSNDEGYLIFRQYGNSVNATINNYQVLKDITENSFTIDCSLQSVSWRLPIDTLYWYAWK